MKIVFTIFWMVAGIHLATAQTGMDTSSFLSSRQQNLIRIAALTARGDLVKLKPALVTGLEGKLTINEIKEAIVHLYAYCGFPRSIRGLQTFMTVIEERKSKGISDNVGSQASPIDNSGSKYERGKEVLDKLLGSPQSGPASGYAAFSPEIDTFLKEHLFADLFERDVLSYVDRELVTISVLSSIGGVEPMLISHLKICLNLGLTPMQLNQFVQVIEFIIGEKEGTKTQLVLDEVIKKKKQK